MLENGLHPSLVDISRFNTFLQFLLLILFIICKFLDFYHTCVIFSKNSSNVFSYFFMMAIR